METIVLLFKLYIAGAALSFPAVLWVARQPRTYMDGGEVMVAVFLWPFLWVYVAIDKLINL